jgi:SAM-dependent methyltransferase
MTDRISALARGARGVLTIARRRGLGYFGYLVKGVALPDAAYRFGWGPAAKPVAQGMFAAARELAADRPTRTELAHLGLMAAGPSTPAPDASVDQIETLMDRAHAAGVAGVFSSFQQIVYAEDGSLRFGDLSRARRYSRGSVNFAGARDLDRREFNRQFNASLLTEAGARALLQRLKAEVPQGYRHYAPIDFGAGLTIGQIASTDSGTGRWEFLNRHVVAPLVADKRVLDLGSNNGSMPLMMLRAGAREVVGIEYTPAIAEFARLNARILAWRDIRRYNVQILTGDMRLFVTQDLGRFDAVTAFCSLYYLPAEDMARIITKAAAMNAVLILQANEAIGDSLPGTMMDLHRIMRDHGYREIAVHTRPGFSRPLLVGYPQVAVGTS